MPNQRLPLTLDHDQIPRILRLERVNAQAIAGLVTHDEDLAALRDQAAVRRAELLGGQPNDAGGLASR